jgi:hypothetical protein
MLRDRRRVIHTATGRALWRDGTLPQLSIFTRHDASDIPGLILHFDLGEIMRCLSLALISGLSAIAFAQMAAAGDTGRPVYDGKPRAFVIAA